MSLGILILINATAASLVGMGVDQVAPRTLAVGVWLTTLLGLTYLLEVARSAA